MLEGSEQPAKSIFSLQNKPQTRHRQRKRARQRARPPGTRTRHAHLTVPVRAHTHACMRARAPTHQQPPISGARVGRRLQLLSPRLPCGLGIRLAAAAPAALAFARRHCSRVLWHPAWRRPLACLGSASSPSPLWTDAALLVPLVPAACVVLLLLLPFLRWLPSAGDERRPRKPTRRPVNPEHAAAVPAAAAAAGKEIVSAMVLASPSPAPGCRLLLCLRPFFRGCSLPHSAERARRWKQVPAVGLERE